MHPTHDDETPDLSLLVALEALIDARNVTRAAERLGLTQSAMSHRLKRLRALLGDPILVPGRGGLVPTPRAEQIAVPVRRGLDELRTAVRSDRGFDPKTSTRTFVVVSADFAEFSILPRVLAYCTEHAPLTCAEMREPWPGMLDALERGEVDLLVGPNTPALPGLVRKQIASEPLMCAVRRGNPHVKRKLDLDTYVDLRHLVIAPTGANAVGIVDAALTKKNLTRVVAMRIPHFIGAPFIVASSDLVVTAPASLLRHAATFLPLTLYPPPLALERSRSSMTWHQRMHDDPGNRWLRELTARCTADAIAEGT